MTEFTIQEKLRYIFGPFENSLDRVFIGIYIDGTTVTGCDTKAENISGEFVLPIKILSFHKLPAEIASDIENSFLKLTGFELIPQDLYLIDKPEISYIGMVNVGHSFDKSKNFMYVPYERYIMFSCYDENGESGFLLVPFFSKNEDYYNCDSEGEVL